MLKVGTVVRVLEPFTHSFPGTFAITEIVEGADGTTAYILGEHGGFDAAYLEVA